MKNIFNVILAALIVTVLFTPIYTLAVSGAEAAERQALSADEGFSEVFDAIINYAIKIVFIVIGILVTKYVIPWLKEHNLYKIVTKAVEAAEKLAENSTIDKKKYVIGVLTSRGITVNAYVDALIEACVLELDRALKNVKKVPDKSGGVS